MIVFSNSVTYFNTLSTVVDASCSYARMMVVRRLTEGVVLFAAVFNSKPNTADLRAATKSAHDDYWAPRMKSLKFAGPMLTDDGSARLGQIVVLDVANREEAESIIENDPFVRVGLFTDYVLRRFNLSVESGKTL